MDKFSLAQRSAVMARIKSKNTTPELVVRKSTHALGYRFRLHRQDLPGKPDLVFVRKRKVIFVNGCFWHGHDCRRGARMPASNTTYWTAKISRNVERDRGNRKALRSMGWEILIVWECQLKKPSELRRRLKAFLCAQSSSSTSSAGTEAGPPRALYRRSASHSSRLA